MSRADRWNQRYSRRDLAWSAAPNEHFMRLVESLPAARALDLGCGEGRHSIWLAERGWQVTAVDFSSVGLAKAQKIAAQRKVDIEFVEADVSQWQAPAAMFELVFALFLHTSPGERERWMATAAAATAPGGLFVYLGHDPLNVAAGSGGPADPAVLPSCQEVTGYLEGFDVRQATTIERQSFDETGHGGDAGQVSLDTLVVAQR